MTDPDDEPMLGAGRPPDAPPPPPETTPDVVSRIERLLRDQPYGVLCTHGEEQAYGSLVAFAASDDLRHVAFSTPVTTRKFQLLAAHPRVALLVDDRTRHADADFMDVSAVTAVGRAVVVERSTPAFDELARSLLERHRYLDELLRSPTGALVRIDVELYVHVERFQTVHRWEPPGAS